MSSIPETPKAQKELIDPSLLHGGEVVYDYECPLKFQDQESKILLDAPFHFRIIIYGPEKHFERIRFEVTMESDLFFFYCCEYDQPTYERLRKDARLTCDFANFPKHIIQLMQFNIDKHPDYHVVFSQVEDDKCVLSFQQVLAIKLCPLFEISFYPESDDFVNSQIQYRFDLARGNLRAAQTEREDLCKVMKCESATMRNTSRTPVGLASGIHSPSAKSTPIGTPRSPK